jgi:restriction endonuclease S subunit
MQVRSPCLLTLGLDSFLGGQVTAYFALTGRYVLSNHMTSIRVLAQDVVDPLWLARKLHYLWHTGLFRSLCRRHVNQASVSLERLKGVVISLPPIEEQRAIAHVLSAIQRAIQATERLIAAAREFKRSLMRHLFTYGPVPLAEAERVPLRDTEIGPMPEHWRIDAIAHIAHLIMGQSPPGDTYDSTAVGVPLLNGPAEFGLQQPLKLKWATSSTKSCEMGDILVCVRGNTTGRLNVADGIYCIGRGVAAIRGDGGQSVQQHKRLPEAEV